MKRVLFLLIYSFGMCSAHEISVSDLTLDQKIGQLFMPGVRVNKTTSINEIEHLITHYHVGGVLLVRNPKNPARQNPVEQFHFIRWLQSLSNVPLLIAEDFEWGLSMRLKDVVRFPRAMTLGALTKEHEFFLYLMAQEIGRQCNLLGVHINFAPVVDINSNPDNPIIGMRSFGQQKDAVARKGLLYMHGLRDAGILSCAKHFPGHGATLKDSHKELPELGHDFRHLLETELCPFKHLIDAGVPLIMLGHLHIPSLDKREHMPSSLSPTVVTALLKDFLQFDGVVVTDGLRMHGVRDHYSPEEIALHAFNAGNDILLDCEDTGRGWHAIKNAVLNGEISLQELDTRVSKILNLKKKISFPIEIPEPKDFITPYATNLKQTLFEAAITLVNDAQNLLPVTPEQQPLIVQLGRSGSDDFMKLLSTISPDQLSFELDDTHMIEKIDAHAETHQTIVIGIFYNRLNPSEGISLATHSLIEHLTRMGKKIIVVLFGTPYAIAKFSTTEHTIIAAYEDDPDTQCAAAEVLIGNRPALGKLPITLT